MTGCKWGRNAFGMGLTNFEEGGMSETPDQDLSGVAETLLIPLY